jgi:sec-independent protein translocase protein TatC
MAEPEADHGREYAAPERPGHDDERPGPPREVRMSFAEHLLELRRRLILAILATLVCAVLGLIFYKPVFEFLMGPVTRLNDKLAAEGLGRPVQPQSKALTDTFMLVFEASMLVGVLLASPVVIYQLWAFVSPGLYPRERKAIMPILTVGVLFFLAGAAFAYFLVFPLTLEFFVRLDLDLEFLPQYVVADYFSFLLLMMVCFGAAFELPLVIAALAKLGLVSPKFLTAQWRYCVMAAFVLGAVLTPGPDMLSMLLMSAALLLLYVLSIGAAWLFYPKGKDAVADADR